MIRRADIAVCLLALSATAAAAQKPPAPRDDVAILVLALDSVHSALTDSIVAATVTVLRRRPTAVDIRALNRRDLLAAFPSELPHASHFTAAELREVAEVFRWLIIGIRDSSTRRDATDIRTTLLVRQPPLREQVLPAVNTSDVDAAATRVAALVLQDSVVVRLRREAGECPDRGLFDFQVDEVAHLIRDGTTVAEARALASRGATYFELVVDPTGHPIPRTVRLLQRVDSATARAAEAVVARWRFMPARRGACRVAQVVDLDVP